MTTQADRVADLVLELNQARRQLAAVRALHAGPHRCWTCQKPSPCPTALALTTTHPPEGTPA